MPKTITGWKNTVDNLVRATDASFSWAQPALQMDRGTAAYFSWPDLKEAALAAKDDSAIAKHLRDRLQMIGKAIGDSQVRKMMGRTNRDNRAIFLSGSPSDRSTMMKEFYELLDQYEALEFEGNKLTRSVVTDNTEPDFTDGKANPYRALAGIKTRGNWNVGKLVAYPINMNNWDFSIDYFLHIWPEMMKQIAIEALDLASGRVVRLDTSVRTVLNSLKNA